MVTGGSRGLGLALARELVDRGARVAICARTESDLRRAEDELRARGGDVIAFPCDVRDCASVDELVALVLDRWGKVDVLFNVAGVIHVGPLDAMTPEDFRDAMDTNCWGALKTVHAVLPAMRRRGWGRIVNIASIGGKQAVPHLLPYVASKFALVGLSNGLRTELAKDGILVTTVSPALLRTGSPRNAIFKGQNRKEYAWFSIGGALPVISTDAVKAARQILSAAQRGDAEVIVTNRMNIGIPIQRLFPGWTTEIFAVLNRILPEMGGIGERAARGDESESSWSPSWVTALSEQAAVELNEVRADPAAHE